MSKDLKKMAAAVEYPVVKEATAITIVAMKKKHFEQLEATSNPAEGHEILGLVGHQLDGWLVIQEGNRLVKCSVVRYLEPHCRRSDYDDQNAFYRELAEDLKTRVPQLFQD